MALSPFMCVLEGCVTSFSHCCDKIPGGRNLEEGLIVGQDLRDEVFHGKKTRQQKSNRAGSFLCLLEKQTEGDAWPWLSSPSLPFLPFQNPASVMLLPAHLKCIF